MMSAAVPQGYKQTEVEGFPIMNRAWRKVRLGTVVTLQRGYDLPHRERKLGLVPIVTSSGFGETHSEARVQAPGVVTGRYGTIGNVFVVHEDFWPLNTTLYVRDFHGNDPFFVAHLLRTIDFHLHSGKSGVPGVNRNDLHEIEVELPPLPEQRAIATALSDVDALLAAQDKLIAKKRDIKQAAMQHLLTGKQRLPGFGGEWEVKRLGDVGTCLRGVSYKGDADLFPHDTQYTKRLLRSNNVQDATVVTADIQFVNHVRVSEHQVMQNDDILICMANGSKALVGKAGFFKVNESYEYTFGAFMGCFRTNSTANPAFVFFLFQTGVYRNYINNLLAGSSINNLKPSSIESLEFPFPSPIEQTAIATVLSDMDADLAALEQQRDKTRALKQGMMQELLTGRICLV